MRSSVVVAAGASAATALFVRERRARRGAERFGAAVLETLLNAIEANDHDTGLHVRRVAACAIVLARAIGLDDEAVHGVERIALFHDVGKIHEALFDIIHDRARLTPAERRAIATHPARGAEVLAPLDNFYPELSAGVLAHHERWDGTGYPRGLKGKRIPLASRIVAIADTYDAVKHSRSYRKGSSDAKAIAVIAEGRASQFDPDLVDLVLLPPILAEFARVDFDHRGGGRRDRRDREESSSAPDITFRWRSETLSSGRPRKSSRAG